MTKLIRLPNGRLKEEKEVELSCPPMGDVEWYVENKLNGTFDIIVAHTAFEAREKGIIKLKCGPDDIFIKLHEKEPYDTHKKKKKTKKKLT